jgi:hypothetical protein
VKPSTYTKAKLSDDGIGIDIDEILYEPIYECGNDTLDLK